MRAQSNIFFSAMKRFLILCSFFLVSLTIGCKNQKTKTEQKQNLEIIKAVKHAYGLEKDLRDHASEFHTREQVLEHFKQGFGIDLANSLTDYSWTGHEIEISDKTMSPPDSITVLSKTEDSAVVYYPVPSDLRALWGLKKYAIDNLRKIDGVWKIFESKNVAAIPAQTKKDANSSNP